MFAEQAGGSYPHPQVVPEWLPSGEIGQLLAPYADRLVRLPSDYQKKAEKCNTEAELLALDDFITFASSGSESDDAAEDLAGHFQDMAAVLGADPDLYGEDGIDWGRTSLRLLDAVTDERDYFLKRRKYASALTASLFSSDPEDRLRFIEAAYETNAARELWSLTPSLSGKGYAIILDGYRDVKSDSAYGADPIAHLQSKRSIQRLGDFAQTFSLPPDVIAEYGQLARRELGKRTRSPHRVLREMVGAHAADQVLEPGCPYAQETLAGISAPYVDRWSFDPYKVPRVALETRFLMDAAEALFPCNSRDRLKGELSALRAGSAWNTLPVLATDMHAVVDQLAIHTVRRYAYPEYKADEALTAEERHAKIYRQLEDRTRMLQSLMAYVDPSVSRASHHRSDSIHSVLETAQLPEHTVVYLHEIMQSVREELAGEDGAMVAKAIHTAARENLPMLWKRASITLNDDTETVSASVAAQERGGSTPNKMAPIVTARVQTGARLSCAAMKIKAPGDEGQGQTDFLTALAEIMIDEAYERGLFNQRAA